MAVTRWRWNVERTHELVERNEDASYFLVRQSLPRRFHKTANLRSPQVPFLRLSRTAENNGMNIQ